MERRIVEDKQIKPQCPPPVDSNSQVCLSYVLVLKTFLFVEQEFLLFKEGTLFLCIKSVYVYEPVTCFGGEIHSWKATPPLWVLTSVTASTAAKTTPPLQSDQLFCLFTTIFWFLDYYGFKLDSIAAWGTSVFKLIIHLIPSVKDFQFSENVYGLIQSIFVLAAVTVMPLAQSLCAGSHFAFFRSLDCPEAYKCFQ